MTLLRRARRADGSTTDVRVTDGLVAAVGSLTAADGEEVHDLDGALLLPSTVEPHAHLDKALTADRAPNPVGDFAGAVDAWHTVATSLTVDDIVERATTTALLGLARGTTAVRTHVDVSTDLGLRCVEALAKVKVDLQTRVDVQVVALISPPTSGPEGADHRALLREAMERGADVVGGCPHLDDDPGAVVEHCLAVAAELERPIDLHTDETLDAGALHLRHFAHLVGATGFPHGATASHCVSLGVQDAATQRAVAEEVAAAGVAVVTLPQTNLFLQARGVATAVPRGLTAVRALLDAGATLAAGGDNVQDPFNAMGRADAFETASLLVTAGHLTPEEAYTAVSDAPRAALGLAPVSVSVGSPADLVAIAAANLREALALGAEERSVWKAGRLVARTRVDCWVA